jgi:hypothetical protein
VLFKSKLVIAAGFAILDKNMVFCEKRAGDRLPKRALVGTLKPGSTKFVL